MTHSVVKPPIQHTPAPPFEEIRRQRRKGTVVLTVTMSALGALLIAGAFFWIGGDEAAIEPAAVTSATTAESPADTGATAATETALVATGLTDVSDIAAQTVDSIVVVEVVIDARGPFDATGSGSGVIISEEGMIVTNAHVVDDASSITVELTDGSAHEASVLTVDSTNDIAVLDIDATGLAAISLGSTDDLAVGDPVIAIGNPLALEGGPSVSTGIVSALDRVLEDADTTLTGIIQTDAAITEGSSGGALLDAQGELIGITTAVGVSSVGVEGIAFAVPVETVSGVLAGLSGV